MTKLQFCLVLISLLVLTLGAAAQVQNGQFTGDVVDPSGAAIPNAKVTATNMGTGWSVATTTNQTGYFAAKELPVGTYKVTVEAPGFKTISNTNLPLNAGTTQHLSIKMQLGQAREVVEVTGEAALVNTEDFKLASTVNASQVANLPLNGRNVYDLVQLTPGAVSVAGTDFENGHNTVVNGLREDFSGYLINGVSNKGLSGGNAITPIQDTVQEFQQLSLNVSAQYGNSAGSVTNLVTKSGSNELHGSVWEFVRNDMFDANQFFVNQQGVGIPKLRFNQFGATVGGPIIKDKLFFFASYQGDRFITVAPPTTVTVESPAFRSAIIANEPNSVASLLYKNFAPTISGTPLFTLDQYVTGGNGAYFTSFNDYLCPTNYVGDPRGEQFLPSKFAHIFGYSPADDAGCANTANSLGVPYQAGFFSRNAPFIYDTISLNKQQSQALGNLLNGNEASGRIDYNVSSKDRIFAQYNYFRSTDQYGPCPTTSCTRGFTSPAVNMLPNAQFSWVHTFSPTLLNEFRAGYAHNGSPFIIIGAADPGVPQVNFDDGTAGFGAYNGYPQIFKEHIYTYSDMVSISHGNHSIKTGVDFRRNIENSEFNVARPSYEFFDPLFFAADAAAEEVAGVDPGIVTGKPAELASNVRHWRNLEVGAYFQDDWKVTHRLTLNLGIRYDLFTRHSELNNLATTFVLGPGNSFIDNITTGAGQIKSANTPAGAPGCDTPIQIAQAQLAGICGPGGFAAAKSLGRGDHNDWGPRVGFAWDMFGNGKTSMRGGFGVSYEGTLYNPLSNSRWNLPYYSFNIADNFLNGDVSNVIYGPANAGCPDCTVAPTFTGPPTNPGQGVGAQATGNLVGWDATNANLAFLTGIIFPQGIRDPYVYNFFLGLQHEILPKTVVEVDYVGTAGHKLFRAENVNRVPGGRLPVGTCVTDNFGRRLCGQIDGVTNFTGVPNPNYGTLRVWENVVNSSYNAMQLSLRHQLSHGLMFNANYTWSHTIDNGSTWHSGSTTANGAAAGEGYTTDATLPQLDRGNSLFDIRQRLVFNYEWDLPGQDLKGAEGAILGGWQLNGIWSFQSGPHWEPFDHRRSSAGGDYNLDGVRNDRPNSSMPGFSSQSHDQWANGWFSPGVSGPATPVFSAPCLGCVGNLGRNTFVGPGIWYADMSLFKNFKLTERFRLQFRWENFNVFNHTNFLLAVSGTEGAHNEINDPEFGKARGTLNARNMQLGLKLTF